MLSKKIAGMIVTGLLVFGLVGGVYAAPPSNFSVQADELDYDMKTGEAIAKGNVVIMQDGSKATGEVANYNSKTKSGSLKGNVVADRGADHITCNEFQIKNDDNYSAIGNAVVIREGKKIEAPQIDYYKSREFAETIGDWARLTDVDGSTLNATKVTYNSKSGVAVATGGVRIHSDARKLTASADKAIYDTKKEGYVELIGNATATQDGNTIKGAKLRLTNANNVAIADGDVQVVYIPEQQPANGQAPKSKNSDVKKTVDAQPAILEKKNQAKA